MGTALILCLLRRVYYNIESRVGDACILGFCVAVAFYTIWKIN